MLMTGWCWLSDKGVLRIINKYRILQKLLELILYLACAKPATRPWDVVTLLYMDEVKIWIGILTGLYTLATIGKERWESS